MFVTVVRIFTMWLRHRCSRVMCVRNLAGKKVMRTEKYSRYHKSFIIGSYINYSGISTNNIENIYWSLSSKKFRTFCLTLLIIFCASSFVTGVLIPLPGHRGGVSESFAHFATFLMLLFTLAQYRSIRQSYKQFGGVTLWWRLDRKSVEFSEQKAIEQSAIQCSRFIPINLRFQLLFPISIRRRVHHHSANFIHCKINANIILIWELFHSLYAYICI